MSAIDPGPGELRAQLDTCCTGDAWQLRQRLQQAEERLRRGQTADRLLRDVTERIARSQERRAARAAARPALDYPEGLPVSAERERILAHLAGHRALVITGETGSGKTTQLPKLCWEAGSGRAGRIALTQPRRLAAVSIAERLREEMACDEDLVAHAVRFDDRRRPATAISVMTDGLLLAEAGRDRHLLDYDCLIIDEAHERSVTIDVLLGIARSLLPRRKDLRLVVTSASIEAQRFADWLSAGLDEPVPVLAVGGRQYPVAVEYRPGADEDLGYLEQAVRVIRDLPAEDERGDVLCFLPTERDILEARRRLQDEAGTTVLPLFGRLSPQEQRAIFRPQRGRKVVLATNIAETSVTVPGIRVVVDAGLARLKRYAQQSRTERLPIEAVAQDSCLQRSGRAGRVAPGRCIRLFSAEDFQARPAHTEPEIRRSNLAGVLLQCLAMRLGDARAFPWLDPPREQAWRQAELLLRELGAVQDGRRGRLELTPAGRRMAAMPCDPAIARVLLAGAAAGEGAAVATVAAFCSVQDPRLRPPGEEARAGQAQQVFRQEAGDLATVLALWRAWQAERGAAAQKRFVQRHFLGWRRMREWADVRRQFLQVLREERQAGLAPHEELDLPAVHKAVLSGFLGNVLMKDEQGPGYRAAGDRSVLLHPGSALAPRSRQERKQDGGAGRADLRWLVAGEIVETSRTFARLCAPIDPAWVVELAGDGVKRRYGEAEYHRRRGQVVCEERISWRGLPVQEQRRVPAVRIDAAAAQECFLREALAGGSLRMRLAVVAGNRRLLARVQGLSDRLRDRSIWVDEDALTAAYRERLSAAEEPIADDRALQAWLRGGGGADRLRIAPEELVEPGLWRLAERDFPEVVHIGGRALPLRYRYAPGEADDGVAVELEETDLADPALAQRERWVPGWLPEIIQAWLKALPKDARRRLIPLGDSAERLAGILRPGTGPLGPALADRLREELGIDAAFEAGRLPDHLRVHVTVRGAGGALLYSGRDPELAAGAETDPLAALRPRHETPPLRVWPEDFQMRVHNGGETLYCGLVRSRAADAGVAARVQLFLDPAARDRWHADGVLALLEAVCAETLERACSEGARIAGCERVFEQSPAALRRQLHLAAWRDEHALQETGDAAAWQMLQEAAAGLLRRHGAQVDAILQELVAVDQELMRRVKRPVKQLAAAGLQAVLQEDRRRLLGTAWTTRLPWRHLQRLPVYLRCAAGLLDADPARIADARTRRSAVLEELDRIARLADLRTLQALGLAGLWRDCRAQAEENILQAAGGPALGDTHMMRFRQRVDAILDPLAEHAQAGRRLLEPLYEIRPYLDRAPASPLKERLQQGLEQLLARLPDTGIGADPALQQRAVQQCLQATRRFLEG